MSCSLDWGVGMPTGTEPKLGLEGEWGSWVDQLHLSLCLAGPIPQLGGVQLQSAISDRKRLYGLTARGSNNYIPQFFTHTIFTHWPGMTMQARFVGTWWRHSAWASPGLLTPLAWFFLEWAGMGPSVHIAHLFSSGLENSISACFLVGGVQSSPFIPSNKGLLLLSHSLERRQVVVRQRHLGSFEQWGLPPLRDG